jgi:hypothetical protein
VGPSFVGQPVNTVIAKPPVMFVAILGLLFGQVSLDLDGPEVVNVVMTKVPCILGSVVVLVHVVAECLDNGLAVDYNIGEGRGAAVARVRRSKGTGSEVKGQKLRGDGGDVPVSRDLGLDGPLSALGVDLEDSSPCLGNLREVDMHGRPIRVDGHPRLEMKGLPVLREAVKEALNGPCVIVLGRAGDGQRSQGGNEFVKKASGFALIEDMPDIQGATTMAAVGINFPTMSP